MALTGEQKKIAIDAYYRTVSEGKHLDVFAAVEAVLADQGADLNAKYVQGFEDCRAQAMNVVDEHDGFLQRIEFLKPTVLAEQARAAEQGQDGIALIAAERRRQIEREGWTPEHDDGHTSGALAIQAAALAIDGTDADLQHPECDEGERVDPFGLVAKHHGQWKRELVIAGALIAAEIDRQGRQEAIKQPAQPPAGDVVEDFKSLYHRVETGEMLLNDFFIHASAVAREGYVSLEKRDARWEKAIHASWRNAVNRNFDLFLEEVRMRLTKPVERVTEPILEIESRHSDYGKDAGGYGVLKFGGDWIGRIDDREAAKKLVDYVAALKAGKHD